MAEKTILEKKAYLTSSEDDVKYGKYKIESYIDIKEAYDKSSSSTSDLKVYAVDAKRPVTISTYDREKKEYVLMSGNYGETVDVTLKNGDDMIAHVPLLKDQADFRWVVYPFDPENTNAFTNKYGYVYRDKFNYQLENHQPSREVTPPDTVNLQVSQKVDGYSKINPNAWYQCKLVPGIISRLPYKISERCIVDTYPFMPEDDSKQLTIQYGNPMDHEWLGHDFGDELASYCESIDYIRKLDLQTEIRYDVEILKTVKLNVGTSTYNVTKEYSQSQCAQAIDVPHLVTIADNIVSSINVQTTLIPTWAGFAGSTQQITYGGNKVTFDLWPGMEGEKRMSSDFMAACDMSAILESTGHIVHANGYKLCVDTMIDRPAVDWIQAQDFKLDMYDGISYSESQATTDLDVVHFDKLRAMIAASGQSIPNAYEYKLTCKLPYSGALIDINERVKDDTVPDEPIYEKQHKYNDDDVELTDDEMKFNVPYYAISHMNTLSHSGNVATYLTPTLYVPSHSGFSFELCLASIYAGSLIRRVGFADYHKFEKFISAGHYRFEKQLPENERDQAYNEQLHPITPDHLNWTNPNINQTEPATLDEKRYCLMLKYSTPYGWLKNARVDTDYVNYDERYSMRDAYEMQIDDSTSNLTYVWDCTEYDNAVSRGGNIQKAFNDASIIVKNPDGSPVETTDEMRRALLLGFQLSMLDQSNRICVAAIGIPLSYDAMSVYFIDAEKSLNASYIQPSDEKLREAGIKTAYDFMPSAVDVSYSHGGYSLHFTSTQSGYAGFTEVPSGEGPASADQTIAITVTLNGQSPIPEV